MRRLARTFLAAFAFAALAAPSPQRPDDARETYTVECTFSNPGYPGPCAVSEVVPRSLTPHAACGKVLACLNDVRCVTKSYCSGTSVRGGWKLVSAAEAKGGPPASGALPRSRAADPAASAPR